MFMQNFYSLKVVWSLTHLQKSAEKILRFKNFEISKTTKMLKNVLIISKYFYEKISFFKNCIKSN